MEDILPVQRQRYEAIRDEDVARRELDDVVRQAFEMAELLHKDQPRGSQKLTYMVHPALVYKLLRLSSAQPVHPSLLAAAFLHDALEDYPKHHATLSHEDAMAKAKALVKSRLDPNVANAVLELLSEVTNPKEFRNKAGKIISKLDWQVMHASEMSDPARLLKICDQTANVIGIIEDNSRWNERKIEEYIDKTERVVAACFESISPESLYFSQAKKAATMFRICADNCKKIVEKHIIKDGNPPNPDQSFLPPEPVASFNLSMLERMAREQPNQPELK